MSIKPQRHLILSVEIGLVLLALLAPLRLLAQNNQTNIEKLEPSVTSEEKKSWNLDAHLEIRNTEDRRPRPANKSTTGIHEVTLGFHGLIQKELGFFVEGSAEQLDGESEFFIEEAYLTILPEFKWLHLKAGQMFYPVGWLGDVDNWFISKPSYYNILFKGNKPLDTGIQAEVYPFGTPLLYASSSTYAGRVFRAVDGRQGEAEARPIEISIRSKTPWFELFATHFEHDLAFYDPVRAQGAGVHTEFSPLPFFKPFTFGTSSEIWKIKEEHPAGAETETDAWMSYSYFGLYQFRFGWRGSESLRNLKLSSGQQTHTLTKEDLFRAEVGILKHLRLIYEDEAVKVQDIALNDRWALRLLADWRF